MEVSAQQRLRVRQLEDLPDPSGKAVLVRATLDLPFGLGEHRPMASLRAELLRETLHWLSGHGARVTVCGDLETTALADVKALVDGLEPGVKVVGADRPAGDTSVEDPEIVAGLVATHDMFVNDSFQSSHQALPSLMLPATRLPSAAGRSLQHDLGILERLIDTPERPLVAVIGGNQPYLRLHGLRGLVLRADKVLVGGMMAIPFLQAIGKQPAGGAPEDFLAECRRVYGLGRSVQHDVVLPVDLTWMAAGGASEVTPAEVVGAGQVVDVGPVTRRSFAELVEGAGTVLWLGSLGRTEVDPFSEGTRSVAAALHPEDSLTILGGDALVNLLHDGGDRAEQISVLTATDAALELLKTGDLPALVPLR